MPTQAPDVTEQADEAKPHVVVPVQAIKAALEQQEGKYAKPETTTLLPEKTTGSASAHAVSRDQLRSYVERIER